MKLFPESAYIQLEFDKVKTLLAEFSFYKFNACMDL